MEEDKIKSLIERENERLRQLPRVFKQDKLCYQGTTVLKNKFHIKDQNTLTAMERKIVGANLTYIQLYPFVGNFDKTHLKDIHFILFGSLYDFAGKFRDTDLSKGQTNFCRCNYLEDYLDSTLRNMNKQILMIKDRDSYVSFLAYFYSELNMAHPFREGNGRTIREFMRQFVEKKNEVISFGNFQLQYSNMDKDSLLEATIYSVRNDTSLLEKEFDKGLVTLKKENLETLDEKRHK